MTDLRQLSTQMRSDWDRRVRHDYRFWMSDGVESDAAMWASGERDYREIIAAVKTQPGMRLLEIGCGVGRLLKAASADFDKVTGIDVSPEAINKARELLGADSRIELICGNGVDLHEIDRESVDAAISFAALSSMPVEVVAHYMMELQRVLKSSSSLVIQLYLGAEQRASREDTLHIRSFRKENFEHAARIAGFSIESIGKQCALSHFSSGESGVEAFIVSLQKSGAACGSPAEIAEALCPGGEPESVDEEGMSEIEVWMTYNYAKTLVELGNLEKAQEALEYACNVCRSATLDVQDLLSRVIKEIEEKQKKEKTMAEAVVHEADNPAVFAENLKVLRQNFPDVASLVEAELAKRATWPDVEVQQTQEGKVVYQAGQCLDHPEKPRAAAEVWVKRLLQEERMKNAGRLVVYGFGMGYHIEALRGGTEKKLSVIEPSIGVFIEAIRARSLWNLFPRLEMLSVGDSKAPDCFTADTEIVLRPQSQTVTHLYATQVKSKFYGKRGITSLHPTIGVLGPLQGGTLPVAGYCLRGLEVLHQRVRGLDVSGFALGFHQFENFVKEKVTQQILQSRYVEMISNVILESINEKPVDILLCMAQAPVTGALLTELRKRGIITVLWFAEDYLRFTYWQQMAQYYDFVFTIQKGECIDVIKAAGAGEVHYLPMACDPAIHREVALSSEEKERWGSPVSFVGAGYHNRQQTFAYLAEMPFKIWGTEWPTCAPFDRMVQENARRLTPEEYVKIFNGTDININLHSSDERDGVDPYGDFINPRTFELAASGSFQLCDTRSLLAELFEPGREIITFNSGSELKDKIRYYLEHPEERKAVVERAKERALREHTYAHRLQDMLSIIYSSKYEHIKARMNASPWQKMLVRAKRHDELYRRCTAAFDRGEEPKLDGLVADIVNGGGKLSETEQKLLFLFHVRKQMIRMAPAGVKAV